MIMNRDKVLLVGAAAKESGHMALEYPIKHALIYFLDSKGFSFHGYVFSMSYYPGFNEIFKDGIEYPYSIELAEDINELIAHNLLRVTYSTVPKISLTENAEHRIEDLKKSIKGEKGWSNYSILKETVNEALLDKRALLDNCYRTYLSKL
jgi:hypothetical protein